MEQILFAFWPSKNRELFARGIENNQRPQNFQRWPASIFFYLNLKCNRFRSLDK